MSSKKLFLNQSYLTLFLTQVLRVASVDCESVEALQEETVRDPDFLARNASYKVSQNIAAMSPQGVWILVLFNNLVPTILYDKQIEGDLPSCDIIWQRVSSKKYLPAKILLNSIEWFVTANQCLEKYHLTWIWIQFTLRWQRSNITL